MTTGNPYIDGIMAQVHQETDRKLRALGAVPLGELISELEKVPEGTVIPGVTDEVRSYRGYYEDLAIEPGEGVTAGALVAVLRDAIGRTFEGYKGGDFTMDRMTRVWVAGYGESSCPLVVGVMRDGDAATLTVKLEDPLW